MAYTYYPSTQEAQVGGSCEFEANIVDIVSSNSAKAT